jgi:hypothetical protein
MGLDDHLKNRTVREIPPKNRPGNFFSGEEGGATDLARAPRGVPRGGIMADTAAEEKNDRSDLFGRRRRTRGWRRRRPRCVASVSLFSSSFPLSFFRHMLQETVIENENGEQNLTPFVDPIFLA